MPAPMILTFTTIPPRLPLLGPALAAFAAQKHRPDAVELYLPKVWRRFPGERPSLPPLPDWVTVVEVDHDHGPATKVLPALERYRGRDIDIGGQDQFGDEQHGAGRYAHEGEADRQRAELVVGADLDARRGQNVETVQLTRAVQRPSRTLTLTSIRPPSSPGSIPCRTAFSTRVSRVIGGQRNK